MFIKVLQMKKDFVREQQIIKIFDNCQFHDQIINRFECFCRAASYETAKNYKSSTENFKIEGNFKIVSLTISNKFQTLVRLTLLFLIRILN